jgi:hypothetical protein
VRNQGCMCVLEAASSSSHWQNSHVIHLLALEVYVHIAESSLHSFGA